MAPLRQPEHAELTLGIDQGQILPWSRHLMFPWMAALEGTMLISGSVSTTPHMNHFLNMEA